MSKTTKIREMMHASGADQIGLKMLAQYPVALSDIEVEMLNTRIVEEIVKVYDATFTEEEVEQLCQAYIDYPILTIFNSPRGEKLMMDCMEVGHQVALEVLE